MQRIARHIPHRFVIRSIPTQRADVWDRLYLLLDEPAANLDLPYQHHILNVARSLAMDGTGVLVVLHDLNLAARYADRVMMLRQGRMAASGRPVDALTCETIKQTLSVEMLRISHPVTGAPYFLDLPVASVDWKGGAKTV
jgi:iron complex transport system ATP-binding protein